MPAYGLCSCLCCCASASAANSASKAAIQGFILYPPFALEMISGEFGTHHGRRDRLSTSYQSLRGRRCLRRLGDTSSLRSGVYRRSQDGPVRCADGLRTSHDYLRSRRTGGALVILGAVLIVTAIFLSGAGRGDLVASLPHANL